MKWIFTAMLGIGSFTSAIASADTRTTTYDYNSYGLLVSIDGPRSDVADVTTLTYDAAGNLATVVNALGQVTRYTDYDGAGRLLRMVNPNGLVTRLAYHPRGWLQAVIAGEGEGASVTHYDYDAAGNITRLTLPDGAHLNFVYDAAGRLLEVSDTSGNRVSYLLDAAGNRLAEETEDASGVVVRTMQRVYDDLGRLRQRIGGDTFSYTRGHKLITVTDALNRVRTLQHDSLGRLIAEIDAARGETRYAHDLRDNPVSIADPRGNVTHYLYDGFDEKILQSSPDTGTTTYLYDAAGNTRSTTDARGITVHYDYDALNRLTGIQYPEPGLDVMFHYDQGENGIGRLTSMEDAAGVTRYAYDMYGNLVHEVRTEDSGIETTIRYRYDSDRRLVGITYPSGRDVGFRRDANGRVTQVQTQFGGRSDMLADDIRHLPFGPADRWITGDGLQTERRFDGAYRLTHIAVGRMIDLAYGYDPVGNVVSITSAADASESQDLGYDVLDRLVAVQGDSGELGFQYDPVGNRLVATHDGARDVLEYEQGSNRLIGHPSVGMQYRHDEAGNRTAMIREDGTGWRYTYRDDNRLHEVIRMDWLVGRNEESPGLVEEVVATFAYNGRGERISKTAKNGTTYFRYGRHGELLAELDDAGAVVREYIYLEGRPLAIVAYHSGADPEEAVVIDNDTVSTGSVGTWMTASNREGAGYGPTHRVAMGGTRSSYRWVPSLDAGAYDVQAWWTADPGNTERAPFVIRHSGFTEVISVDQRERGGQWVSLGTFDFDGSGDEQIELSDYNGRTVADAVRLAPRGAASEERRSAEIQYVHTDHLGTPLVLTDTAGRTLWRAAYQPFGMATIEGDPSLQPLRFPGQYCDEETGLHYNYFRDYDPLVGRYLQSDPIGLAGGLNTYAYVSSNPFRHIDPYGLFQWHGNWCGGDWTGGFEKQWGHLTPDDWRNVKGPIDPLDACCVVHDKDYYECREKHSCDPDARTHCFKSADRRLYRCSRENPIGGGFDEWGLREYMRRSRPGPESNKACCEK